MDIKLKYISIFFWGLISNMALAQSEPILLCGSDHVDSTLSASFPNSELNTLKYEKAYQSSVFDLRELTKSQNQSLPIVVHIVHNNGPENISNNQIYDGITHLNDAFANVGYYDPNTGVNTGISFCLAARSDLNTASDGINRIVSPLTSLEYEAEDAALKNLIGWDTREYINVWVVKEICFHGNCGVAGYAYPPYAHGSFVDGIVIEAGYFGKSPEKSTVLVHEMGHFLGLLHTFQKGCPNADCLEDGDRVCDTPPDNVTGNFFCSSTVNSCNSDEDDDSINNPYRSVSLGGLGDQIDQFQNYMDYGINECFDRFTSGQKERMHFFLENIRNSLCDSKACSDPCDNPIVASFSNSGLNINVGETVMFTNTSSNTSNFQWLLDNSEIGLTEDISYTFNEVGIFEFTLVAIPSTIACDTQSVSVIVEVICPVIAVLDYTLTDKTLDFESLSTNGNTQYWEITDNSGFIIFSSTDPIDQFTFNTSGTYQLCLYVDGNLCSDVDCVYIQIFNIGGGEDCNNGLDDDGDGLVDLFDPDCPCEDYAYQAQCPIDCQYIPDSFPVFSMKLQWQSEIIGSYLNVNCFKLGDINQDGAIEVVAKSFTGADVFSVNIKDSIDIINGLNGQTISKFESNKNDKTNIARYPLGLADLDNNGNSEICFNDFDTLNCYTSSGSLFWQSTNTSLIRSSTTGFADFNQDGKTELYSSNNIFNGQNGNQLSPKTTLSGCNSYWPIPVDDSNCSYSFCIAADLRSHPGLELACGNIVYEVKINNTNDSIGNILTPIVANSPVKDGLTSIGDINGDGQLDVIVVRSNIYISGGGVYVWDPRTQELIAQSPAGTAGGVAFVGDVDGDCLPEIGMTFQYELRMYKYNGTTDLQLMYNIPTTDGSGFTGITMFDFNQDGKNELVYRDETDLRIINGETGVTISSTTIQSATGIDHPIIADVDNDGQAEILVSGFISDESEQRIFCFESATEPWAPARSVWNQIGYNPSMVNDDLTIPRYPHNIAEPLIGTENCLRNECNTPYNNFMVQATYRTQEGCVQWLADDDLSVSAYANCIGDSLEICIIAISSDTIDITNPIPVTCYPLGPNIAADEILDVINVSSDTTCIKIAWPTLFDSIAIIINDTGYFYPPALPYDYNITECDYSNNVFILSWEDFAPKTLDLGPDITKCQSEVISFNAGADFESYLWNDFSIDSIYSSSFEGDHYVEATDLCGRIYRDTVEIIIDPSDQISIAGTSLEMCLGDSLDFSISTLYLNIQWHPSALVDCNNCLSVNVKSDTSFTLIAIAQEGSCVTVDTTYVEVKSPILDQRSQSICEGDSLMFYGQFIKLEGIYEHRVNYCDSLVILDLEVLDLSETNNIASYCKGDSIYLLDQWITAPGNYSEAYTANNGCDSISYFNVSEVESFETPLAQQICEGDSIEVGNQWFKEEGIYAIPLTSASGCDSTVNLDLQVTDMIETPIAQTICEGDSIQIDSLWFFTEGMHIVDLITTAGCDSIITLSLLVNDNTDIALDSSFCQGDSIYLVNEWVFDQGTYTYDLGNVLGCDSTVVYNVTFNPIDMLIEDITLCNGDSLLIDNVWIKVEGIYDDLAGSTNCLTKQIDLRFTTIIEEIDNAILCPGDTLVVNGETITEAGVYSYDLVSHFGCDSIYQLTTIQIDPIDPPTLVVDCESLEIDAIILLADGWTAVWSNGTSGSESSFQGETQGSVQLLHVGQCELNYNFDLPLLPDLSVLPVFDDIQANTNEQFDIDLGLDLDVWDISWSSNALLNCDDCSEVILTALNNETINLTLTHILGCTYEYSFDLIVTANNDVYFPNIFSANGDNINDTWLVDLSNTTSNEIAIYDRWGSRVAYWENQKTIAWDGLFLGQALEQGVYVFSANYTLDSGELVSFYGNITLLR